MFYRLIQLPWIVFAAYWLINSFKTRANVRKESALSRYGVMLLLASGYALLFSDRARIGVLGVSLIPRSSASAILGIVLTWLGVALAIWARYHLGQNWSARVTIKENHQLVRSGPYAQLRHPIYSGIILATIGTALTIGEWGCLMGILLVLTGFSLKAMKEENMLTEQFGSAFEEHRKHTGFLIPRFR
jgi:protein-S-isoprenylcysteine O-methyltransferase Ste14